MLPSNLQCDSQFTLISSLTPASMAVSSQFGFGFTFADIYLWNWLFIALAEVKIYLCYTTATLFE
jgi:hypothetical protein